MKITKQLLFTGGIVGSLLTFASCGSSDSSDQIYQRWQATNFENPLADSMKKEQEHYIDTLSIVPEDMAAYFETDDINEIKRILAEQMKDSEEIMAITSDLLSLEFLKDQKVIFHSHPENDTLNFKFSEDKKAITIFADEGAGEDFFNIEKISDSELVISQTQDNLTNKIYFRKFDQSQDADKAKNAFDKINEKTMMQ